MIICKACGDHKQPEDFYAGDKTCKECRKQRAREYRIENIDKVREYDRNRPNKDARREENKLRYKKRMSTEEGRRMEREAKARWQKKNTLKRAAHIIVGNAARDGKLSPQPCEACFNTHDIHAHHEDYTKPLEITWLCRKCHSKRHKEINQMIRDGKDLSDRGF